MTQLILLPKAHIEKTIVQPEGPKPNVSIDPALFDLVSLRMAQIRQCPARAEKHWLDLQARGENEELLVQLKVWRESPFFSNKEKAALTLGEAISLDPAKPILDQFLEEASYHFKKEELLSLLLAIMAVNDSSYLTSCDAAEETSPIMPSKACNLVQTHRLPLYWKKLAQQLTDREILVQE